MTNLIRFVFLWYNDNRGDGMKVYNKLVRDNIPEIMVSRGCKPVTRILNDEEYLSELNKKLLEEVNEYLSDNNIEELADIKEVFLAILKAKNISDEELENVRIDKVNKRGSFNDKVYLEYEE